MDFLLRMARMVLDNVLSRLTEQFNVVQEMAMNPMRAIVQQVVGGAWKGTGADAFVEEVNSMMIPNVGRVGDTITTMTSNLQQARDIMDRADEAVEQLVRARLTDQFRFY